MIDIESISWENFLGYGNYTSRLNFDDYPGVCLIEGEHDENEEREEGDEKLNGSGKSSIFEAIIWGLFGNLSKKSNPGDKIINWFTGKNCKVHIKTKDGYEIIRMRKYEGLDETLVFKDGQDITRSTSKPVQQFINETFNIDFNTFTRSRVFSQSASGFMELSDVKMRSVLEKMMYVDNISPIADTAKSKLVGINNEIEVIQSKIDSVDSDILSIEERIDELKLKDAGFEEDKLEKIEQIKQKLLYEKEDILSRISKINEQIKSKKLEKDNQEKFDIDDIRKQWDRYNVDKEKVEKLEDGISETSHKIQQLNNELSLLNHEIDSHVSGDKINIDEVKKDIKLQKNISISIDKLRSDKDSIIAKTAKIEAKIETDEKFINSNIGPGECPKCKQEVTEEHVEKEKEQVQKDIDKEKKVVSLAEKEIDEINLKISELESKKSHVISLDDANLKNIQIDESNHLNEQKIIDRDKLKLKIEKLTKARDIASSSINKPKEPLTSVSEAETSNKYIDNIDSEIESLELRIVEIKKDFKTKVLENNANIKRIKEEKSPYDKMISKDRAVILSKKEEKESLIKKLNEKKTLKLHVDYIRESYGNKRKIKAFWIGELIPDFNKYLKYYLDHFEVRDKLYFNELLSPKMDRWSYITHSGGECKRIDLSIMFALNDLHVNNFGHQSNFMFLDEVDGKLDPFTINKLVSLLTDDISKRDDGLNNIFVISHRKEMKDRFPHKIRVKNKQERAYINNE